ncbi:type II toxin-antitoxin system RelE/ParE family toxin [Spirosoma horti]
MLQGPKKYTVQFDEAALRDIKKLPHKAKAQIIETAEGLSETPRPEGVEFLTKFKGFYRVRSGNYRLVYAIQDDNTLVIIAAVGDRKDIYKKLEQRLT